MLHIINLGVNMIIVDGNNVAYESVTNNIPRIGNLKALITTCEGTGILLILIRSNLKYKIDDRDALEELIKLGIVREVPSQFDDDLLALQIAKDFDYMIISNDYYRQYEAIFSKEWIKKHRVACFIHKGKAYLSKKIEIKSDQSNIEFSKYLDKIPA